MNKRKDYYPEYFNRFTCISSECPDTCCRSWDVVVDEESYSFYTSVKSDFGKRIINSIEIEEDGDMVFKKRNDQCPFLNSSLLCDIYSNLGAEHICETCREFPRLCQDYTEFAEYMLSLACPEACSIILSSSPMQSIYDISDVKKTDNGYSAEYMNFLIAARKRVITIFTDNNLSFKDDLKNALCFCELVQNMIDNDCFVRDDLEKLNSDFEYINDEKISSDFVFEAYNSFEIMDESWGKNMLTSAGYVLCDSAATDNEFRNLALNYIYRYFLTAIDSYDIISCIKRIYCAYIVCSAMISKNKAENSFSERVLIIQRYSKEIDHSYENYLLLRDLFEIDPDFSSENLIKTL